MLVSTITVSAETIGELAGSTIVSVGIKCDWGHGRDTCQVSVSCYEALKMHYKCHLKTLQSKKYKSSTWRSQLSCKLSRCNSDGVGYNSVDSLWRHIESSHFSRVLLACPIEGCRRSNFRGISAIEKHFSEDHMHLTGTTCTLPSPLLKPSWKPFVPCTLPGIIPLPPNPNPGCVLVSALPAKKPCIRHDHSSSPPSRPATQAPYMGSPRKQSQRQVPNLGVLEDEDDLKIPNFHPLPKSPSLWSEEIIIWRPPTMFDMELARPQQMLDRPISETPISISYAVFAKYVDELERSGKLGAS